MVVVVVLSLLELLFLLLFGNKIIYNLSVCIFVGGVMVVLLFDYNLSVCIFVGGVMVVLLFDYNLSVYLLVG